MMNVVNICKLLNKKALERSSVHSISTTEEEMSIAINLLDLLEELSNSDRFTIESEDSLEVSDVDHFDPNYLVEIEDDEEQQVVENRQFSLEYMQRVVDFARPSVFFYNLTTCFSTSYTSYAIKAISRISCKQRKPSTKNGSV